MRRAPEVALALLAAWPAPARAVVDPVEESAPAPFVVAVGAQPLACGAAFGVQCTGVPLSRTRVLTSAHCLRLEQAIGSVDVLEPRDGQPDRVIGVTRWWKHPRYDGAEAWDVAMLELEEPLEGALPSLVTGGTPAMAVGDTLTVFGFGAASHAGDGVGVLRAGTLRVTEVGPSELRLEAAPSMSCKGDSGGPVGRVRDGRWEIVALTTRGDPGCRRWGGALRLDALSELLDPSREQAASPPVLPGPAAAYRSLCASTCASDEDCPAPTRCLGEPGGAGQCVPAGLPPGELVGRGSCQAGCDACVQLWPGAACECYRFCRRAPTSPGGCALAGGEAPGAGALLLLALLSVRWWRAT